MKQEIYYSRIPDGQSKLESEIKVSFKIIIFFVK